MLDLTLFKRPAMSGVSLAAFTISGSIYAMFLYLTLYMQDVLGFGPFAAGVRLLPITLLAFGIAPIAGKMTVKVGARYLLGLGLLLISLGCVLTTHVQADSTWTVLLPGFIVAGIGIGIINPVVASATVSVVPPEHSGMASGATSTFRQVGIATGIAGLGAVFLSQIRPATVNALAATPAGRAVVAHGGSQLSAAVAEGGVRQLAASIPDVPVRHALIAAYHVGFTATFDHLMAIAAVVSLVGAVGSLILVRQRDFVPSLSLDDEEASGAVGGSADDAAADDVAAAEAGAGLITSPAPSAASVPAREAPTSTPAK
jgi:MFS family permease